MAQGFELGTKSQKAVNLAIENDPGFAVGRQEGLIGCVGKIDDAEPAKPDLDGAIELKSAGVRSPMPYRLERRFVAPV